MRDDPRLSEVSDGPLVRAGRSRIHLYRAFTITAEDCTGPVYLPPPKQRAILMRHATAYGSQSAHTYQGDRAIHFTSASLVREVIISHRTNRHERLFRVRVKLLGSLKSLAHGRRWFVDFSGLPLGFGLFHGLASRVLRQSGLGFDSQAELK